MRLSFFSRSRIKQETGFGLFRFSSENNNLIGISDTITQEELDFSICYLYQTKEIVLYFNYLDILSKRDSIILEVEISVHSRKEIIISTIASFTYKKPYCIFSGIDLINDNHNSLPDLLIRVEFIMDKDFLNIKSYERNTYINVILPNKISGDKIYENGFKFLLSIEECKCITNLYEIASNNLGHVVTQEQFEVYLSVPYLNFLIGPLHNKDLISDYCVNGMTNNFVFIPRKTIIPVFFVEKTNDLSFFGIYSITEIIPQFSQYYSKLETNGRIFEEGMIVRPGSIIYGYPNYQKYIQISIDGIINEIPYDATYSDLQMIISESLPQPKPHPSKIVFQTTNCYLLPDEYPTAYLMKDFKLKYKILHDSFTVQSLALAYIFIITFVNEKFAKETKELWFKKSILFDFDETIKKSFKIKDWNYVISLHSGNVIKNIITADQAKEHINIRIDLIKGKAINDMEGFCSNYERGFSISLELRSITSIDNIDTGSMTIGFVNLTKRELIADLIKKYSHVFKDKKKTISFYYLINDKTKEINRKDSIINQIYFSNFKLRYSEFRPILLVIK